MLYWWANKNDVYCFSIEMNGNLELEEESNHDLVSRLEKPLRVKREDLSSLSDNDNGRKMVNL
jgi:polyphosphate kinase